MVKVYTFLPSLMIILLKTIHIFFFRKLFVSFVMMVLLSLLVVLLVLVMSFNHSMCVGCCHFVSSTLLSLLSFNHCVECYCVCVMCRCKEWYGCTGVVGGGG